MTSHDIAEAIGNIDHIADLHARYTVMELRALAAEAEATELRGLLRDIHRASQEIARQRDLVSRVAMQVVAQRNQARGEITDLALACRLLTKAVANRETQLGQAYADIRALEERETALLVELSKARGERDALHRTAGALADEKSGIANDWLAARQEADRLLAELEAARAVVTISRRGFGTSEDIERAHAFDPTALTRAIERYDAATKARQS